MVHIWYIVFWKARFKLTRFVGILALSSFDIEWNTLTKNKKELK